MKRTAFFLLTAAVASSLRLGAQTYTYVDLGTAPYSDTFGASAYNDNQVGYGLVNGQPQALLWQSTAAVVNGIAGTYSLEEVGSATLATGQQVAVRWAGTATSAVSLNPVGASSSQILAAGGDSQDAGTAVFSGITHAVYWNGNTPIDLNPAGALRSEALGVQTYISGSGTLSETEVGDYTTSGGAVHACYWSNTASSVVDLHPASGYLSSTATSVLYFYSTSYSRFEIDIVGYGTNSSGTTVPLIWKIPQTNPSTTLIDLSSYLPAGTTSARAVAIDPTDNTIVGNATINGANHAFLLGLTVIPTFETPAQNLSTIANVPYRYTVAAKGFPLPTYSISGTLPPGWSISPTTGVISGTPTQTGGFLSGIVYATNSAGTRGQTFDISVVGPPRILN